MLNHRVGCPAPLLVMTYAIEPRERLHWPSSHSLGHAMAPIAYHDHQRDRSPRWLYPNLLHSSTLCHKLDPSQQWTPPSGEPRGLRSVSSLPSNTCSRTHRLRAASSFASRKAPHSAELRVLSSTTLKSLSIMINEWLSGPGLAHLCSAALAHL